MYQFRKLNMFKLRSSVSEFGAALIGLGKKIQRRFPCSCSSPWCLAEVHVEPENLVEYHEFRRDMDKTLKIVKANELAEAKFDPWSTLVEQCVACLQNEELCDDCAF